MPRRSSGPRLYLDPKRKTWIIRDGTSFGRTGCGEADRRGAEKALKEYIEDKHRPAPSPTPTIGEVLDAYGKDVGQHVRAPGTVAHTINNVLKVWGTKRVDFISARSCRAYADKRPMAAARRDLETLRAALNHWHREYGPLSVLPTVVLPPKSAPRERWLTRSEAARLLWAARRTPHLARFILIGLYTGTRAGAILAAQWEWVDIERGIMRRKAAGESESNKRRPPVRLGKRLMCHMRRWMAADRKRSIGTVVHYEGVPVTKLRRSWATARLRAGLDASVTPHTLRHTRATWLMQRGNDAWDVAKSLGMSLGILERTYGHWHPEWQKDLD